jgi:hypothetical protein
MSVRKQTVTSFPGHRWKHCTNCDGCMLCHGGLALCEVCGGLEGALPTDCPGERMHNVIEDEVYAGKVDYRRDSGWVQEPSRHSPSSRQQKGK